MAAILIHHYPADREAAERLVSALNERGHSATLDPSALTPNARHCRIVLLSPNGSADDEPALFQAAIQALADDELVLATLDPAVVPPFGFQDFKPVDLSRWLAGAGAKALQLLENRIGDVLGRAPFSPPKSIPARGGGGAGWARMLSVVVAIVLAGVLGAKAFEELYEPITETIHSLDALDGIQQNFADALKNFEHAGRVLERAKSEEQQLGEAVKVVCSTGANVSASDPKCSAARGAVDNTDSKLTDARRERREATLQVFERRRLVEAEEAAGREARNAQANVNRACPRCTPAKRREKQRRKEYSEVLPKPKLPGSVSLKDLKTWATELRALYWYYELFDKNQLQETAQGQNLSELPLRPSCRDLVEKFGDKPAINGKAPKRPSNRRLQYYYNKHMKPDDELRKLFAKAAEHSGQLEGRIYEAFKANAICGLMIQKIVALDQWISAYENQQKICTSCQKARGLLTRTERDWSTAQSARRRFDRGMHGESPQTRLDAANEEIRQLRGERSKRLGEAQEICQKVQTEACNSAQREKDDATTRVNQAQETRTNAETKVQVLLQQARFERNEICAQADRHREAIFFDRSKSDQMGSNCEKAKEIVKKMEGRASGAGVSLPREDTKLLSPYTDFRHASFLPVGLADVELWGWLRELLPEDQRPYMLIYALGLSLIAAFIAYRIARLFGVRGPVRLPRYLRLEPNRSWDTFISYAHRNSREVLPIADEIEHLSIRAWIDRKGMCVGESWAARIAGAIRNSNSYTLMASEEAFGSQNVFRELHVAVYRNKPIKPFRLDDAVIPDEWVYFLAVENQIMLKGLSRRELGSVLADAYQ